MSLSYTGKLFRRIAICCGAWTETPHEIWKHHFLAKYSDDYETRPVFLHKRREDGKWTCEMHPSDDKEYEFWKALKWLEENGYIKRRMGTYRYGHWKYYHIGHGIKIGLTEKGLAAAPYYIKQKED